MQSRSIGRSQSKLGEMVYAQAQTEPKQAKAHKAEPSSAKKDDDVVDADFEEVKTTKIMGPSEKSANPTIRAFLFLT